MGEDDPHEPHAAKPDNDGESDVCGGGERREHKKEPQREEGQDELYFTAPRGGESTVLGVVVGELLLVGVSTGDADSENDADDTHECRDRAAQLC